MAKDRGVLHKTNNEVPRSSLDLWRSALKITYVPAMLQGFIGAAVAVVNSDLPRFWLLPLVPAAIATSFAIERLIPYHNDWNNDRGDSRSSTRPASMPRSRLSRC